MQARDVMTRDVVTVGPDTSARYAAEVLAERGFAALPVVDDDGRLVGIVTEADVLRDRLPQDPRLHLRRSEIAAVPPSPLVRGVMTARARTVLATADVADVARLFVDDRLRSVPVVDGERLVGILSRRDLLRTLVRDDDDIRRDLLALVEAYTGRSGTWDVAVTEGVAELRRARDGAPDGGNPDGGDPVGGDPAEERAVRTLAATVPGVVAVRLTPAAPQVARQAAGA
ncbi:CBS domain-containing protein [Modestobacter sp. NPDC049651]|uniref:CBS domain-containing protein n=1 Tax=unclassified Modestobacter TaxID=2643866 RepID=UPI0033D44019